MKFIGIKLDSVKSVGIEIFRNFFRLFSAIFSLERLAFSKSFSKFFFSNFFKDCFDFGFFFLLELFFPKIKNQFN